MARDEYDHLRESADITSPRAGLCTCLIGDPCPFRSVGDHLCTYCDHDDHSRHDFASARAEADAEHARVHVFGEATSADGGRTWQCRLCEGDIEPPPPLMLGDVIRATERADADRREYARRDPKRWA